MVPVGFVPQGGPVDLEKYCLSTVSTVERKSRSAPSSKPNGITFEDEDESYKVKPTKIEEQNTPSENGISWRKLKGSLFGHAPYITELICKVNGPGQLLAFIFQSILLSVSNTVLISNPLSGIIILCTMFYSAPLSAFLGLICLISGIFTSLWVARLPFEMIRNGSITFNCFLLGSIIGPLVSATNPTFNEIMQLTLICIATGTFVIFCWGGFHGLLSRANIPVLNAPCNLLALIFIYSGLASFFSVVQPSSIELYRNKLNDENATINENQGLNATLNESISIDDLSDLSGMKGTVDCIDWYGVLGGIILTQGQIFQTHSIITSSMVFFSVLLYSPILFVQQILGSTIGTLIGLVLSDQPQNDVYNGGWGFNSLLTSAAIGGFFVSYNFQSVLLSIIGSILTAFFYGALVKNGFTALGIPFMIITWLFLPLSLVPSESDDESESSCFILYKVTEFSTPEINRRCLNNLVTSDDKYIRPKSSVLPL